MLNYELSKKLYEASFPYGQSSFNTRYIDPDTAINYGVPSLKELIEACGGSFHCLIHTVNGGVDGNKEFWSAGKNADVKEWCNGPTPIEAVANLYLAVHNK